MSDLIMPVAKVTAQVDLEDIKAGLEKEDIVKVVRCKDCEFYTEDEKWCRRLGLCGAFDADDYCSKAEREEECIQGQ